MKKCVFCQIRDREIPKEFEYEDKDVMVFPDINPLKPIHILIVPKKHIKDFLDLDDRAILENVKTIAQKMIKKHGLANKGYRFHVNGGGAQLIDHLHFHIVGPIGRAVEM